LLGQIIDYGLRFYNKPHPLFTLKNLRFFREPEFNMVTSPPVSPSPFKERGRKKKRGADAPFRVVYQYGKISI
jgi:hypothetical protein